MHQCVLEIIRRDRSCYVVPLTPRRSLRVAKFLASLAAHFKGDCYVYVGTPDQMEKLCSEYRNWLGQHRVGG